LTIFPETMMPYPWNQAPVEGLNAVQKSLHIANNRAVLIGSVGVQNERFYNSGIWLDGQGDVLNPVRYDKIHLLPFGENIPWGFAWFVKAMHIPLGGYDVGQSRTPFELKTPTGAVRMGTNICYENVFGEEMATWHKEDTQAPNVWVNLTNLGWFGDARTSAAHEQFVQMSRARAMELARPMLTVTNTGVSAYITPDGAVAQRLPAQVRSVGDWQVQPYQGLSLYVAWGNLPVFGWVGLFLAWLLWTKVKRER
jgi:apolipoprotein N-acyltransferase